MWKPYFGFYRTLWQAMPVCKAWTLVKGKKLARLHWADTTIGDQDLRITHHEPEWYEMPQALCAVSAFPAAVFSIHSLVSQQLCQGAGHTANEPPDGGWQRELSMRSLLLVPSRESSQGWVGITWRHLMLLSRGQLASKQA